MNTASNASSPKRPLSLWARASCCALFLMAAIPAAAQHRFADISITPDSLPAQSLKFGYWEHRFKVVNHSATRAHRVELTAPAQHLAGGYDWFSSISRSLVVGPGSQVTVSLFQPPFSMSGGNMAVVIDGRRQPATVPFNGLRGYYNWEDFQILVSREAPQLFFSGADKVFEQQAKASGRSYRRSFSVHRFDAPVTSWSTHWLGYTAYQGILVTGSELRAMPAPVWSSVLRYVECGGHLTVVGPWEAPASVKRAHAFVKGLTVYYVGFGTCIVVPGGQASELRLEQWESIREAWRQVSQPGRTSGDLQAANRQFPVFEGLGLPLRGLFLVLVGFSVLIGPINALVLRLKRKMIWMLWTIPIISLLACAVILSYVLAVEGLTSYSRSEGLTILDQAGHRAVTVGWIAFYSTFKPRGGLHFDFDTALFPIVEGDHRYRRRGAALAVDWSRDQHLENGWISARVPAHFLIRKAEVRRERLLVREDDPDSPMVVNGLGCEIETLALADRNGEIFLASGIPAGAQAALTRAPAGVRATGAPDVLNQAYKRDWIQNVALFSRLGPDLLRPDSYIAVLRGSPFIEPGLAGADFVTRRSVVYGLTRGGADEN